MKPIEATRLRSGKQLQSEVVVVGAGPAGIVLALELANAGHRVLLIESGGESFDASVQRLSDTTGDDPPHLHMSLASRRQVGGTSNVWAGRCVPFDPIDFEPRPIAAGARWPITYEELRSYFGSACGWLACGAPNFDAEEVPTLARRSLIPGWPNAEVRATALERWSLPTNFGHRYLARLHSSPLITLITGLTCTEIVCRSGDAVDHLVARTLGGACVTVRAARYVLATGGLEATRLLFASRRMHPRGIGNHSGHLGRWYMAHVECRIANVRFTTSPRATIYDFERDPDGVYVRRRFTFSKEFLLAHDQPNGAMWLVNPELGDCTHHSGILSFLYLMLVSPVGRYLLPEAIRMGQLKTTHPTSHRSHLLNVIRELRPTARFALVSGYQRYLKRGRRVPGVFVPNASNVYPLLYHGEHLPHHSSRVTLDSQRDALGMPRLRTQLRFEDVDVRGAIRAHEHFDRYLRRHRLGRLEPLYDDLQGAIRRQLFGGAHQTGITRMSARPEDGVLDRNLAVHGFSDLFVCSSSAFATSSQANPTFMIVVFALRLADHLRRTLR